MKAQYPERKLVTYDDELYSRKTKIFNTVQDVLYHISGNFYDK